MDPWRSLVDPETQDRAKELAAELKKEVPSGHILHGIPARAVAVRVDQDDVLFEIDLAETPLAVVHMTWHQESNPSWPGTTVFTSWQHWIQAEMLPEHEDHIL